MFSSFSPIPVGAASLAQVHLATTRDGKQVAVKVQHQTVRAHSTADIMGLEVSMVFNVDRLGHSTADLIGLDLSMVFNVQGIPLPT